jgi:hypothetical protein
MFLEDEFATERLRAHRISISFLIALTALAASITAVLGLFSVVRAEETAQKTRELAGLVRPNDVNSGSLLFRSKEPGFYVEAPRLKTLGRTGDQPWRVGVDIAGAAGGAGISSQIEKRTSSVKLPQTATRADRQITRGLTMLLLALAAASGLAVWRRRVRGFTLTEAGRNGR